MVIKKTTSARCALFFIVTQTLLLAGCESLPKKWHNSVSESINTTLTEARRVHVPQQVVQAMQPNMTADMPSRQPELIKPRFDLTANKTPAREVFMGLVKGTPYSMVVHPDIDGEISLHLKQVTIDEALDALQKVYGYAYRNDGNRYYVLGRGMQTRLFSINYLNLSRKGHSNTRVSSAELNAAGNGSDGAAVAPVGSHGIQIKTDSENDFWKELQLSLQTIIGDKEDRRVITHPQSGLVIVRALPDELSMVDDFLGTTQAVVNRQVILEAKIIEVELNDSYQTGINWSGLGTSGSSSILASQIGGGTALSAGVSEISGLSGNLQPDGSYSPISSAATSAFGGVFSLAIKARKFSAFLEFLQGQGDVQVLSSPRVSTVNNQRAVIKVGGDEFFVTGISNSSSTSGSTTTETPTVELTPFFSGIALDVTPQIDENNNIILHIHPTVSSVSQRDKTFVISGKAFSLPLAISNIQESDNVVRAETGQVIVIGGLMKEASSDESTSIPLLGDLPLIGQLFKHTKITRIKKELVILLKPTVVDNNDLWGESIKDSQRRSAELMQSSSRKAFFNETEK